jgi:tRNA-2-methylthio-N6-dimethylallyladenosine synthase
MNFHDSERMAGILETEGYSLTDRPEDADLIILNTCSIREKAEQKFYSDLGRLREVKRKNPEIKIGVSGCIAQQEGERIFKKTPYVSLILGPQNLESLPELIEVEKKSDLEDRPAYAKAELPSHRLDKVKALVSVMHGCDNFCSYCVVPYTRGRERSRPWRDIFREIEGLARAGYKEVSLIGQNVNSYGRNLEDNTDFTELLYRLHDIKGIERIRFVTSHPKDFSERLIKAMKELPKLCEHMHLPLQAGSDRILNLMNRGYTYREYKEKADKLRSEIPDIAITTDIITGFPCETEEDFEKTIVALREIRFDGIFVFKYSKRPNTSALSLPGHLQDEIKAGRFSRVLNIQDPITLEKNRGLIGKNIEILVEGKSKTDNDKITGRTRTNKIVNFRGNIESKGKIIMVKITGARHYSLDGEPFDFAQGKPL